MCQIHSHKFLNFFEKTVWRESPNNPKPWASLTVYSGSILVAGSPMKGTVGVWEVGCFDQLHITTQAVDPALSSPPTYVKFDVIFRKTFLVSECTDLVFSCSDTIQPLQAQGQRWLWPWNQLRRAGRDRAECRTALSLHNWKLCFYIKGGFSLRDMPCP